MKTPEQPVIDEVIREVVRLSGGGKRLSSNRTRGIYSSMNLPGLDHLVSVRDAHRRWSDWGYDPRGRAVLDLGSNVGSMSWEALNLGASSVVGYEFNTDRVTLTNRIALEWDLPASFGWADFNDGVPDEKIEVVVCTAVDDYIDDRESFYEELHRATGEVLLFECNVRRGQSREETAGMLRDAGFSVVTDLGPGHAGLVSKKRHIYRCQP